MVTTVVANGNSYNDGPTPPGNMDAGGYSTNFLAMISDVMIELSTRIANGGAGLVAASTTSLTIGSGSKPLTITTGKTFAVGTYVNLYSSSTPTAFMLGAITAFNSGTGAMTVNVLNGDTGGSGTYTDWIVVVSGRKGNQGLTGVSYNFSTSITAADPGAGNVRGNTGTISAVTSLFFDASDTFGRDLTANLLGWAGSTSTNKGQIWARLQTDLSQEAQFNIVSVTDNSGWLTVAVTYVGPGVSPTWANGAALMFDFSRTGDKGETGATGPPGAGSTLFVAANGVSTGTARPMNNFIGANGLVISAVDNPGSTRTDITITAPAPAFNRFNYDNFGAV